MRRRRTAPAARPLLDAALNRSLFSPQPHQGRIQTAQIQRAAGEFPPVCAGGVVSPGDASAAPCLQRDPFIQMYEERPVDVAAYVCRLLDQMPASPSSPTYMD